MACSRAMVNMKGRNRTIGDKKMLGIFAQTYLTATRTGCIKVRDIRHDRRAGRARCHDWQSASHGL